MNKEMCLFRFLEEVVCDKGEAKRSQATGFLTVSVPKLKPDEIISPLEGACQLKKAKINWLEIIAIFFYLFLVSDINFVFIIRVLNSIPGQGFNILIEKLMASRTNSEDIRYRIFKSE